MKKEVENKKSFIRVLSCSESSGDESEKELPIENTEELKKYLLTDDDKLIKKKSPKKTKKLFKKRGTSSRNNVDQEKSVKQKKSTQKDSPQKYVLKGDDFKKLSKKARKLGATSLDYSKKKKNKYMVEYNGKKIHFGSVNTSDDFIIHKDPDRREKYLTKAKKITNKDGELTYQLPSYPNYWSVKLLN